MIKGLQITGQSLSIDLLCPCIVAFVEKYKSVFGDNAQGQTSMSRNALVDMICLARDESEEIVRFAATENGADRARLDTEGGCPSHPYFDPDEEVVYHPATWERPVVKKKAPY